MALTTLDSVKAWLGVSSATDDALLARLVSASSAYVETWLNRSILSATYSDTRDGNGRTRMMLPQAPVTAISSVTVDGVAVPAATTATMSGYVFTETSVGLRGYTFTSGMNNVVIQYTAGFDVVPTDVEQAVIELIGRRYKERDRIGLVSKGLAGETITYTQKDMSDGIKTLLQSYRRVVPV